ncbi:RagB/SusD family nutrient uptake outer membrane protein [Pontibacter anaerobius]|uniref:RagB/SusD family nutrient uptake outer membrane protein n=1 Tax=Pontibacter anaerobius TaxID=2993940 RepID=A0ABT3REK6_9BACT|nr:RagB/SusD family nutrient uptake outer membrane protein [Pontibacter anaerobius]MCX2740059.1 RagB/SusD family nutrient uptake outer membrane protein [Pontibacter anaerobius]
MKRYTIKKVLTVASLAGVLLGVQACELDAEVFDQAEASKFPSNEEEFLSIVGSTYGQLRGFLDPVLVLNEATTDELVVPTRGPDWYDNGSWQQMAKHEWTPVSPGQMNGSWEWAYGIIASANINLAGLKNNNLEVQGKETVVSEVRMLRAFAYFWLLDMFGNVAILTEDTPPGNPPQNTRQEVYDFIEKEILESLPNLREDAGLATYSRFTQGAANTLLAKLYLNAEVYTGTPQWQKALDATNAVINSPAGFALNDDYLENFAVNNVRIADTYKENIFVIPYDKVLAGGMNMQMRTLHYAQGVVYGLAASPWNGFATRAEFYNKFSDTDKRKAMWLAGPQLDNSGQVITYTDAVDNKEKDLVFTPEISSLERALQNEGVRNVKYEVQRNNSRNDQDNDLVVFRYADVLLMKAEALLRLGNAGEALLLVNEVRERADVAPLTSITLDTLLEERGRELAWEGWRRNDLIRFGKYTGSTWQFKTNTQPHRILFPIPAQQLSNNPNLKQNPGY